MKNLLYILCLFSFHFAFAQSELPEGFGDYRTIENAEPGKSYTQAYISPTFKKIVWRDSVLLLENNRHLLTNLTEGKDYEIITEIVETRPAYTIWEFEVPKIDTIIETKTIIVDRICEEIEPMPKFEGQVIEERIKVFPVDYLFIPRVIKESDWYEFDAHYGKYNKERDVLISFALLEYPEWYRSIRKNVFQKNGKWWTETIADTLTITRQKKISSAYQIEAKQILSVLDTFQIITFLNFKINTNVAFSTIEQRIIDKNGYFTEWEELRGGVCTLYARFDKKIQKALIDKGYELFETGAIDWKTQMALDKFLKDNNLSINWWEFDKLYEILKIEKQ